MENTNKCNPCTEWGKTAKEMFDVNTSMIKKYVKKHGRQPFESESGEIMNIKNWEK